LKGVEVGWAGDKGKEPEIIDWLRRKGKLGGEAKATSDAKSKSPSPIDGVKGDTPQSKTRPSDSSIYSSFPSSFVRVHYILLAFHELTMCYTSRTSNIHSLITSEHETRRRRFRLRISDAYEDEAG